MVRIGDVQLSGRLFLAPMAGVTDAAFRLLCRRHGAALCTTEMISSKALMYQDAKTRTLLVQPEGDEPLAVQLFGSDPGCMAEAAQKLLTLCRPIIIDINMGCPAPKVTKGLAGSALMRDPELASRIIQAVKAASGGIPVTVKFRKGWDDDHINCVEFARMAEESGAVAVTVHGRTREQFYSGRADWDIIARVKESVSIPVIGNGDIFKPSDAVRMMRHTGCDAVMIARGAQGNPWIFRGAAAALDAYVDAASSGSADSFDDTAWDRIYLPSDRELVDTVLEHMNMLAEKYGDRGLLMMRKHVAWYIKGRPGAARLRDAAFRAVTRRDFIELFESFSGSAE